MPSHRFCNSQKANYALAALSVILGSFALFAFNNLSTPNTDELYQTLSVKHYSDSPLAMLTFWIGNIWTRIFGFSILSLRNLLSTEQLITVGIATYWLWRHTRNIRAMRCRISADMRPLPHVYLFLIQLGRWRIYFRHRCPDSNPIHYRQSETV